MTFMLEKFDIASVFLYEPCQYYKYTLCRTDMKLIQSKYGCNDQELIHSSGTLDPGYQWESDKLTVRYHKREPRGQRFPSR